MQKPELVIAVPTPQPLAKEYEEWLRARAAEVAKALPEFQVVMVNTCDSQSHNRNGIVHEFLANKAAAWVWFVEPDLQWEAWHVAALVKTMRPVIGILHTTCEAWPKWQVTFYDEIKPDEAGVVAVPEVSANGMLVHRSVFTRLLGNPTLRLSFRDDNSWEPHHAFFQQALVKFKGVDRLVREEHFFQWLCRECGIGVYVHGKMRLKRKGPDGILYPQSGETPNLVPVPAPDVSEWPVVENDGAVVVVIQSCEKDHEQANRLFNFIEDFTKAKRRYSVIIAQSAPGLGYPEGPNRLAWNTIKFYADNIEVAPKCILLIEPDCVPVAPDWIDQLSEEWDRAAGKGKLVLGHWQKESGGHINGNLMFSPNLANVVDLGDKPTIRPWDICYPPLFEPHWARTGLIKNLYRRTNVTDAEIETPAVGTRRPVLIHGVRDESVWSYVKRKSQ